LISYMANHLHLRTAYLSLTRGDGGQNLIGTEKGAALGILRTQELLEARRIDGGEQFFTRAVDFGYSKSSDESLEIWDKEKVLYDMVWVIRQFRPDVLITRFPTTRYAGHGHHSASAILAEEAMDLAGDPKAFPDQLKVLSVWQPKRLLHNTGTFWEKGLTEKVLASGEYISVDVGTYSPLMGKSYSEVASESRSMHKSQGFGSARGKGSRTEYLKFIKGDPPGDRIMDGIETSWKRLERGAEIQQLMNNLLGQINPVDPSALVPMLVNVHQLLRELPPSHYRDLKLQELEQLILDCSGIWVEVTARKQAASAGEKVGLTASIIARSGFRTELKNLHLNGRDTAVNQLLKANELLNIPTTLKVPATADSRAYWLRQPFEGHYRFSGVSNIGRPENESPFQYRFDIAIEGLPLTLTTALYYKWTDRVEGERYRHFTVLPDATVNLPENVYIFTGDQPQEVVAVVTAHKDNFEGTVRLNVPKGWRVEPATATVSLDKSGSEAKTTFSVFPSSKPSSGTLAAEVVAGGKTWSRSFREITYPHVMYQVLMPEATAKVVRMDLNEAAKGSSIGYIPGAGDEIPEGLAQLGYTVTILEPEALRTANLSEFDAIMTGIRAYNTQKSLSALNPVLLEYVNQGGKLIVQYNTSRGLATKDIGPYPFKISRKRVTRENAAVTFLKPEHALLNTPNKLSKGDFDGWVQERGLYFASEWADEYETLLAWNDPGEEPQQGGLLVANYGKGAFIYTGISFFRQLPAGVPGAYRLLANLIAYGDSK
ncbi:MAG: PIG-L family deacetylase, partial [Bacteroidota bacterium]